MMDAREQAFIERMDKLKAKQAEQEKLEREKLTQDYLRRTGRKELKP